MTFNVVDVERLERAELDILVTLYRNPHVYRYDDQIYEVHSQYYTTRYRIIPEVPLPSDLCSATKAFDPTRCECRSLRAIPFAEDVVRRLTKMWALAS